MSTLRLSRSVSAARYRVPKLARASHRVDPRAVPPVRSATLRCPSFWVVNVLASSFDAAADRAESRAPHLSMGPPPRWRCSWCRGLVHLSMRALAAAIVSQPPPHPCECFEVCAFAFAYVLRRLRRLPDDCASSPIGRPRRTMSSRLPSRCLRSCSPFDVHARIRSRLPTVVRSTHFHEQNVPRSSSALVHDQELLAVHTFLCLPCAPLDAHGPHPSAHSPRAREFVSRFDEASGRSSSF
jgi:hypothetical protein